MVHLHSVPHVLLPMLMIVRTLYQVSNEQCELSPKYFATSAKSVFQVIMGMLFPLKSFDPFFPLLFLFFEWVDIILEFCFKSLSI